MEEDYRGLGVDLKQLATRVESYFRKEGFETNIDMNPEWYRVQARKMGMLRRAVGAARCIDVNIRGSPDNFEVEMTSGEWGKNIATSAVLGVLTLGTLWLGAVGLSAVTYRHLEEKLFDYVQWQVDELRGSAGESRPAAAAVQAAVPAADLTAAIPRCPTCNKRIAATYKVCPYCGLDLASLQARCPSCAFVIDPSYNVCPICGVRLTWTATKLTTQ